MIKIANIILLQFVLIVSVYGQNVSGYLKQQAGQKLILVGYNGFKIQEFSSTPINNDGSFSLNFPYSYKGMGYIEASDKSQLYVVLAESNIIIKGTHLQELDSIKYESTIENSLFAQYSTEHNKIELALSGWNFLLPQYTTIEGLKEQTEYVGYIQKEINRLTSVDSALLNSIDTSLYVSWYLPIVKLVNDMPYSVKGHPERISKHIADFRRINFNDKRLHHSGLLDDLLTGHYLMLKNSGLGLDSMYVEMNISTNYIINNLTENDQLLNEIADYLFYVMEQRNLFVAAEHLAITILTNSSCVLTDKLSYQLETYRKMKIGNTAPEIDFTKGNLTRKDSLIETKDLTDINTKNILIVFGSSWCPTCVTEITTLLSYYQEWKSKGIEVVFISLDKNEVEFTAFTKDLPWVSYCDYKSWDSPVTKNYYVFATPTLFLLDKKREILAKPISIEQVNSWVKTNL